MSYGSGLIYFQCQTPKHWYEQVPKSQRARWKSLESIVSFGWCGSALLGGVLADKKSYAFTFLITAGLQFIGATVWILLAPLVAAEKNLDEKKNDGGENAEVMSGVLRYLLGSLSCCCRMTKAQKRRFQILKIQNKLRWSNHY